MVGSNIHASLKAILLRDGRVRTGIGVDYTAILWAVEGCAEHRSTSTSSTSWLCLEDTDSLCRLRRTIVTSSIAPFIGVVPKEELGAPKSLPVDEEVRFGDIDPHQGESSRLVSPLEVFVTYLRFVEEPPVDHATDKSVVPRSLQYKRVALELENLAKENAFQIEEGREVHLAGLDTKNKGPRMCLEKILARLRFGFLKMTRAFD